MRLTYLLMTLITFNSCKPIIQKKQQQQNILTLDTSKSLKFNLKK